MLQPVDFSQWLNISQTSLVSFQEFMNVLSLSLFNVQVLAVCQVYDFIRPGISLVELNEKSI